MSYVRYVYIRLHNEVTHGFLFVPVKLHLVSNLQKKKKKKNGLVYLLVIKKLVYLVVCGCLLVVDDDY